MKGGDFQKASRGGAGFSTLLRQLQFALALTTIVPILAISYLIFRYASPAVLAGEGVWGLILAVGVLMLTGTRMIFRLITRAGETAEESKSDDFSSRLETIQGQLSKEGRSIRHTVAEATALIGVIPLLALGYVVVRYVIPIQTTENIVLLTAIVSIVLLLGIQQIQQLTQRIIRAAAGAKLVRLETGMPQKDYGADEIGSLSTDLYRIAGKLSTRADELQQTKTFLSHLFECFPQPLLAVRSSGTISMANPMAARLLGYEDGELLGMNILSFFAEQGFAEKLLAGKCEAGRETTWRTKGGALVPVALFSAALSQGEQEPSLVLVGTDLTERKQLEDELQHAQKMEAVGLLAGGIAHDFNNILTVIQGHGYFIREGLDRGNPLNAELDNLQKTLERASSLTYQLIAFSKKQLLNPRTINLNTVIESMESLLSRLLGENIEIKTVFSPDLDNVKADKGQMEQIIVNLAVNAQDAMHGGGRLTIESANTILDDAYALRHPNVTSGPYVMISITDTGCGMTEDIIKKIFDPFFTTKESGKGSGLGLSTAYGIVKQHGGHIFVYSEPGEGSSFKVYLPRVGDEVEAAYASRKFSGSPRGTETVLLVEDDDGLLDMSRRALADHGYKVLAAENGKKALDISALHDGNIDLLVTDVVMPEMGG
ncbi:MAG: ATP-binding protein [Candidatus Tritonobacter lacicola]|nr:ATP-binding protein [Candidatus Tritonobacter lacicola]